MAEDRANNPARVPNLEMPATGWASADDRLAFEKNFKINRTDEESARIKSTPLYKAIEGKNIASVSGPARRDKDTPGSGKWDFGGGRKRYDIVEATEEQTGPREMTKFDKNNKHHVGIISATDGSNEGMMMHPGGYFSFPKKETTERKMVKAPEKIKGTENKYTKKLQNSEAAKKADIERRNAALKKKK
jgi:hypothetical protein